MKQKDPIEKKYYDGNILREVRVGYESKLGFDYFIFHNTCGPARFLFNNEQRVCVEEYHIMSKLHREDGPAVIFYSYEDDKIYKDYLYYLNGIPISKEDLYGKMSVENKLRFIFEEYY
jgi:hypothetical protein